MAPTFKETELVNLGASIAAGCKACTSYHFRKAKEAGASDEEIKNTIAYSISIRDLAKKEMENHAMNLIGVLEQPDVNADTLEPDRVKVLVSIGAAFAVNCTSTLNDYIALAESAGITTEDINTIFRPVTMVKRKAALYVDKIALGFEEQKGEPDDCGCEKSESNAHPKINNLDRDVEKGCC
jgi:AhpD family alkylhydroperoxidase